MSAHDNYLDPDHHLWPEEPSEDYINGTTLVAEFFSADIASPDWEKDVERTLSTSCGAWIEFHDWGIRIGSIVEGCNSGTAIYPLRYADKFTSADIQARIDAIEAEAEAIWGWANRPCDKKGRWRKNGSTTQADLGIDAPDVYFDYQHLGPDGRSS